MAEDPARRAVLITRPAAEAAATAALVAARGWEPVVAPLLVVHMAANLAGAADAVVVSSGNALPALHAFVNRPLLAVGDATAARARALGFRAVHSAAGDAAALVALVARTVAPGAALLLPTAAGEGHMLADGLVAAGYRVRREVAYRIEPVGGLPGAAEAALRSGVLRAGLFLSARTARIFAGVLPPALYPAVAGVEALAIGAPAADELRALPWGRVRVSLAPTLEQVLALL